jgi:hypothetical protein
MSMQSQNQSFHSGFLQSATGQMTAVAVVAIAVILLAWNYVF